MSIAQIPAAEPEEQYLKPKPAQQDSDDWPIFALHDAEIFRPDEPTIPANLLTAGVHNAFTVRGVLQPLDKNLSKRRTHDWPPRKKPCIEITQVRIFSYGLVDGKVELWAAGKAGWFSVLPHPDHIVMYVDMLRAVRMLFHIADCSVNVGKPKKSKSGASQQSDLILREWALTEKLAGGTEEAYRILKKHKHFLIASILDGKEGLDPATNPVFKYLEKSFGPLVKQLREPPQPLVREKPPLESASKKRKRASETPVANTPDNTQRESTGGSDTPRRPRKQQRKSLRQSHPTRLDSADDDQVTSEGDAELQPPDSETRSSALKGKSSLRPKPSKFVAQPTSTTASSPGIPLKSDTSDHPTSLEPMPDVTMRDPDDEHDQKAQTRRTSNVESSQATPLSMFDEGISLSLDPTDPAKPLAPFKINGTTYELQPGDIKPSKGDTWSCPLDGCTHKVYGASKPFSQKLINGHYRLHLKDEDTESRLQLVRRMQGPGLSVKRLTSRIQMMGAFPTPVVRRL